VSYKTACIFQGGHLLLGQLVNLPVEFARSADAHSYGDVIRQAAPPASLQATVDWSSSTECQLQPLAVSVRTHARIREGDELVVGGYISGNCDGGGGSNSSNSVMRRVQRCALL
jgi:hypothetical protein